MNDDLSESISTRSISPFNNGSTSASGAPFDQSPALSPSIAPSIMSNEGLRKATLRTKTRPSRTQAIVVVGPPGLEFD